MADNVNIIVIKSTPSTQHGLSLRKAGYSSIILQLLEHGLRQDLQNNQSGKVSFEASSKKGWNLSLTSTPFVLQTISFAFSRVSLLQSQAYTVVLGLERKMGTTVLPFPQPTSKTFALSLLLRSSGNSFSKYLLSLKNLPHVWRRWKLVQASEGGGGGGVSGVPTVVGNGERW